MELTGLCRTDLRIIRHGHRDLVLPRIPGEEVVGRIVAKAVEDMISHSLPVNLLDEALQLVEELESINILLCPKI